MIMRQSINDLELEKVIGLVKGYCRSISGKELCEKIRPYDNFKALTGELEATNEYLQAVLSGENTPKISFEPIDGEIKLLAIENSYLFAEGLVKVKTVSQLTNDFIEYFDKFKEFYPQINRKLEKVYHSDEIVSPINKIIDIHGSVRDDASDGLFTIRKRKNTCESDIDRCFMADYSKYRSLGYLSEIGESIVDYRRVLAVEPMHRKKVAGIFLGTSKTGSIVFIEPQSTNNLNRELDELKIAEKEEIIRLLKICTEAIRPHRPLLAASKKILSELDLLQAKALYAAEINACLPALSPDKNIKLIKAHHPLLLHRNKSEGKKTYPQDIDLNSRQRITVISGPNAGGKSITLKTVGLLQLMIQSAILIPVEKHSQISFFKTIISDIGDKQSIENHLSTYSARLKNMADFLKISDNDTLFLIDEFGTGSDPELGGALAEVFLEELWKRGSYGILTTHYSNIKLKAEELDGVINASMLFNEQSLKPRYLLLTGQAGSSFTFEVAQSSGIDKTLIENAKNKVSISKITLEKTIAKLQKEKNIASIKADELTKAEQASKKNAEELEKAGIKLRQKLENYQGLYDYHSKQIQLGKKIGELAENYFFKKQNKEQITDSFFKLLAIENAKRTEKAKLAKAEELEKKSRKEKLEEVKKRREVQKAAELEKLRIKAMEAELESDIKPIRDEKQKEKEELQKQEPENQTPKDYIFKVGDKVRIVGSFSCGIIDKMKKHTATIDYGRFTTQVKTSELELVLAAKKTKK